MIQQLAHASVTHDRDGSRSLLEYANENRNEGFFNDVTLKVGADFFPANRMVLSCFSDVFERMFKVEMKERYEETVEVKQVDSNSIKILLEYIYTGHIEIDNQNAMELLAAADYLQLEDVKEYCFEFLISILVPSSWFAIRAAADLYRNDQLQRHLRWDMSTNLKEIAQMEEFKALTKDELTGVLTELFRNQTEEQSVYEAILSWIKYDEVGRKKDFPCLFRLIALHNLSGQFVEEVVAKEKLVVESNECLKLVVQAFAAVLKTPQSLSRILCLGGEHTSQRCFEVFGSSGPMSNQYPNLPVPLRNHVSLRLNDFIYCIGGIWNKHNRAGVYRLHVTELQTWESVALLPKPMHSMGAVVYCDFLLVAGGLGVETMANVHCYDSSSNEWKQLASLNQKRFACALVCCNSGVYALGGFGQSGELNSVELLPYLKGKWKFVASMQTPRVYLAAVQLNNKIYALGGKSGKSKTTRLKSVEKYDPGTDTWTFVQSMFSVRSVLWACVMHGKIYVVGGTAVDEVVKSIDCYDPIQDLWSTVGETSHELLYHSIVKI